MLSKPNGSKYNEYFQIVGFSTEQFQPSSFNRAVGVVSPQRAGLIDRHGKCKSL